MMRDWPRYDVRTFPAGEGWRVEVYRRDDRLGKGACMSLHSETREVMRFDLFEPAHEHWAVLDAPRMHYPKRWPVKRYIVVAVNNLVRNHRMAVRLSGEDSLPDRAMLQTQARAIRGELGRLAG